MANNILSVWKKRDYEDVQRANLKVKVSSYTLTMAMSMAKGLGMTVGEFVEICILSAQIGGHEWEKAAGKRNEALKDKRATDKAIKRYKKKVAKKHLLTEEKSELRESMQRMIDFGCESDKAKFISRYIDQEVKDVEFFKKKGQ